MPYIGKSPKNSVRSRFTYQATAGQTSFSGSDANALTLSYTDSLYMDVYQNGVLLKAGTDYTATTGTTVVLVSSASADDVVEMVVYDVFDVADTYSTSNADSRFVNVTGDTMTGDLTIGDATASDRKILFDGNAQDFHIGLDDSTDSLTIGLGSTLGTTSHMVIDSDGRTQINANKATGFACEIFNDGNNSNRYGLHLQCGTDDASGTNYAITFYDGDVTSQGNITFTSGTVTYGAFTAHHEISLPDADKSSGYPYGTLLETTAIYYTQKDGTDTERGIRYVTQKSSSQYSRKILGTYCGDLLAVADISGTYANNLHQAAVLGDGHILCNNSGGNIKVGDGICASATAGIGQKADKLCMIIGIAQKDITFSGSETVLVPVQYGLQQFTPWTD